MKIHYATLALLAGAAVLCNSCVAPAAGYATYSAPTPGGVISTGVSWTNASYDSDGFPIFGYSYGRPVYGYTASGAAIFTIAALTALCFVPHWGPASWYHGHYHYPHGIHRVAAPPRFPQGHRPAVRPASGIKPPPAPPKHNSVVRPGHSAPGASFGRPGNVPHAPNAVKPGQFSPSHSVKPGSPAKPGQIKPGVMNRPGGAMHHASANRPGNAMRHASANRPGSAMSHASASRPGSAAPSFGSSASTPRTLPAPAGGRPVASVPSSSVSRPSISTMPAPSGRSVASMHSRGSAAGHAPRGGHGGRR